MSVLLFGVSHRSAPVSVLEQLSTDESEQVKIVDRLMQSPLVTEAMMLSTCNRVEVYAVVDAFHGGLSAIGQVLAEQSGMTVPELTKYAYVRYSEAAVEHLFAVASGLDSAVVGEQQVLGQVRRAYAAAEANRTVGRILHELAQRALAVGKRVHSETEIDAAGASVRLLDPPDIVDPGKLQRAPQVTFDLTPVDGADAYRTEISSDADFLELIRDQRTTGLHAAFDNLPDGNYFVRVSATDKHGIDGLPQVFTFSRHLDTTNAAATPIEGNGYAFRWHVDGGALSARYRFILSNHADLSAPLIDLLDVSGGEMSVAHLAPGKYYWTIVVDTFENGRLLSIPSEIRSFTQTR